MPPPLPDGIEISTDPAWLDLEVIHGFLRTSYWSPGIPREIVELAIRGSLCFGAFADGRQVAFARVVSDRATFAWVCDVFVLESHRHRGIADALMSAVMAHPELQGLRRWSLATRDAHTLYRRHGFEPVDDPSRSMEIRRPDIYRAAAKGRGSSQR